MSKIVTRIDSLSAKIANLKQVIRADANKLNKSKEDEDKSTDVRGALKSAIATPKTAEKTKKRSKDNTGTTIRKPMTIFKTVEKKANGKEVEKTVEKINVKNNTRESRRSPSRIKNDGGSSADNCKSPLALSKQRTNR